MAKWFITVDQIAESGGRSSRRKPVESDASLMSDAVEEALEEWHLIHAEAGHYQITVTDLNMSPDAPERHRRMQETA
jgi:hypothetical protein